MHSVSTMFGADCSSCFTYTVRTHRHTKKVTHTHSPHTHASATASVRKNAKSSEQPAFQYYYCVDRPTALCETTLQLLQCSWLNIYPPLDCKANAEADTLSIRI